MSTYYDEVFEAAEFIRARVPHVPHIAVVLGSGLGDLADRVGGALTLAYVDIPNWPPSGVVGHAGKLVVGELAGRRVAVLSGRAHYYEGHSLQRSTFGIR